MSEQDQKILQLTDALLDSKTQILKDKQLQVELYNRIEQGLTEIQKLKEENHKLTKKNIANLAEFNEKVNKASERVTTIKGQNKKLEIKALDLKTKVDLQHKRIAELEEMKEPGKLIAKLKEADRKVDEARERVGDSALIVRHLRSRISKMAKTIKEMEGDWREAQ